MAWAAVALDPEDRCVAGEIERHDSSSEADAAPDFVEAGRHRDKDAD